MSAPNSDLRRQPQFKILKYFQKRLQQLKLELNAYINPILNHTKNSVAQTIANSLHNTREEEVTFDNVQASIPLI